MHGSQLLSRVTPSDMSLSFVNTDLMGVAISLPIIATAATILRFWARMSKTDGRLCADDWILLATLMLCWAHSINTLVAASVGGVNNINSPTSLRQLGVKNALGVKFLFSDSFILCQNVHLDLLQPTIFHQSTFHEGVVRPDGDLEPMVALINDYPIESAWQNAALARHRFDFNTWYIVYSGLSISFDFIILGFPVPMIKKLHVNTKQKISILGIFWLGGFVCVAAIVRFVFLHQTIYRLKDYGSNQYSYITKAFMWAEIEPNTSVVAACLPTYGPLFQKMSSWSEFRKTSTWFRSNPTNISHELNSCHTYYDLDRTVGSKSKGATDDLMTCKGVYKEQGNCADNVMHYEDRVLENS
ncbi:hypothetical protein B0J11DRAFT_593143 [Dendryphion nanum]|uniref:Rhodopsin domain-containing protein n=1 Tax=Dendryphion nanum TaxID=256645 RepID=A0A9P9IF21_9PLEO|nr:hypothetical protein B0J11DRAFT_593143 [Dendryphion nanum]